MKPLSTGIVGVIGKPGSGKSYSMAMMMAQLIVQNRRPVYTNLPMKWDNMRAYIARMTEGSDEYKQSLAKLIRKCTKQHFQRFMERLQVINQRSEQLKDDYDQLLDEDIREKIAKADDISQIDEEIDSAAWQQACDEQALEDGGAVYYGRNANWFPPGTVFILDELHKWYNSRQYRNEDQAVQDFTSMHRHMQCRIFIITQRWLNVSLSFRSMCDELIILKNIARVSFGPIKLKDYGIDILRAKWVMTDDYDEVNECMKPGRRAQVTEYYFPNWWPDHRDIYDVYRSTSHAGGIEEQAAELKKVRAKMVGSSVIDEEELDVAEKMKKNRRAWMPPMMIGLGFGLFVGRCSGPNVNDAVEKMQAAQDQQQQTQLVQSDELTTQQQRTWNTTKLTGANHNGVFVDDGFVPVGGLYEDIKLDRVDPIAGVSRWSTFDGRGVSWTVGDVGRWMPTVNAAAEVRGDAQPATAGGS
ncbi:MAG: zonular occludens toxin domain-containing protein [Planctomycetota bacterium]